MEEVIKDLKERFDWKSFKECCNYGNLTETKIRSVVTYLEVYLYKYNLSVEDTLLIFDKILEGEL